jgi:hypothetical protein
MMSAAVDADHGFHGFMFPAHSERLSFIHSREAPHTVSIIVLTVTQWDDLYHTSLEWCLKLFVAADDLNYFAQSGQQ